MKKRAKICIVLALVICTLLSLMISVNAASGNFDTDNYTGGENFGGAASSSSWGARKATGTRFVIELDDEEVGGTQSYRYYVNYMQNKKQTDSALATGAMFYGGSLNSSRFWKNGTINTNGMVASEMVTNFNNKTTTPVTDPPSGSGNWFNDWRADGKINLSITENGTKFLAKVIAARALDFNDTTTYNQMKSIVEGTYEGKLAVRAEIVFSLKTPKDEQNVLITYNEFRKIANDGSHGGGVAWVRKGGYKIGGKVVEGGALDMVACKLYEDEKEYSLRNGTVNCSCNFLNGSWSSTYDSSKKRVFIKNSGYSGSETLVSDTNNSARKVPNLCSVCVGTNKYYSLGLRDESGRTISPNIKMSSGNAVGMEWAINVPGTDFMSSKGMSTSKPVIFEGWDYVYSEYVQPVATYTVTERYVNETTGAEIDKKVTSNITSGTKYTVDKKTITGYTYSKSNPTGTTFTITADKEIVHYYKPVTYTVTERYVNETTGAEIDKKVTSNITSGTKYTVDKKMITGYTYSKSNPTGTTFTITSNKEIVHYYKKVYTVTEKYLETGTNKVLTTAKTTSNLTSGSKYTVEIKSFDGYVYSKSNPTGTTHTITSDTEIIHYYNKVYTVTERYMLKGTNKELGVGPRKTAIESGGIYYVTIETIAGYNYDSSSPAGTSHTITSNKEIIHYYTKIEIPPQDLIYSKPTVTKTAKWTNTEKTEAEITITVKAEYNKGATKIESSDIIYLLDKSYSMGNEVNTSYTKVRNAIGDKLNYYLTGQYAGAGNRIGFATFSSNLYTYGNTSTVVDEHNGRVRTSYNRPNGSKLTSVNALTYAQAKSRIFDNFDTRANAAVPKKYTARFYTTPNDITNVVNGLSKHGDGENTNFDLPLFYAQWLLENRSKADQSRKSYIIFITEGQPYPFDDSARKSQAKNNPDFRNSDYLANKFYAQIAKDLRNTYGTEIYAIILDRDKDSSSMWETICGDASHVFYTPDTQTDAIKAVQQIHDKIALQMQKSVEYADVASMSLTDMINTDYFEVISTNASQTCTTNIGSTSISNNKVFWNLGTVSYNKKCSDGQWPTLKIKIRLKNENTTGHLNTNYNKPSDDQCILTYPDGTVPAPTPWLDREDSNYDVTIKFINDENDSIIKTLTIPNIKKNTYWPTSESIKREYAVTNPTGTWGTKYKGYELNTSKIIVDGITYMLSNMPENLYMNSDKVIEFHYKLEPAELVTRTFKVVELNGQIIGVSQVGEENKTIKIEKATNVSKPSNPSGTTYVGHKVTYDAEPVVDHTTVYNGLNSATKASVKITEGQNMACVDFIYKESNYVLTLKYQDENGNTLEYQDENGNTMYGTKSNYYPAGTKVTPEVPSIITKDGITYDYLNRTDNQNQNAIITVDKSKEVIFVYKMRAIPVTVKYVDKDTNTEIIPERVIPVLPGQTTTIDETGIPPEYSFVERSDGKDRTEPVGPVNGPITITLYYKKVGVTLEYRDVETGAIIAPTVEIPAHIGDIITPTENGIPAEYCFVKRSDNKSRTSTIGPITDSVTVIFYYTKLNVSIEYRDIVNNNPIAPPKTNIPIMPGETIPADESGVPSKYTFVKRSDGKSRTSPIGPITEPETIIFYYINIDITSTDGLPVISYPRISTDHTYQGVKTAIVGETIEVRIPNKGNSSEIHGQMVEFGIPEPDEGWNGKYAQIKYLICTCDVYYNENPYPAGDPIKVAERNVNSISDTTIELVIPEWVHEGSYEIKAIVGSEKVALEALLGDNKWSEKWNEIYAEIAAVGTVEFDVLGRVYDFTITNLIEDKYWPNSLYNNNKEFKANGAVVNGVEKDKVENVGSLPIGQGGNQPEKYRYGIALGSTFFFNINTLGLKNTTISIKPQFAYVTNDGEIVEADLYSKVDGKYELINTNEEVGLQTKLNNEHKKERTSLGLELVKAFGITGFEELKTNYMYNIGNYSKLVLDKTQRMPFAEYFAEEGITLYDGDVDAQNRVLESACHWYGEYRLPSSTIVMEKGENPNNEKDRKDHELKEGFIVVMFQIVTKDSSDADYLKYNNQVKGDQWGNENGAKETETMTLTLPLVAGQDVGENSKVNIKVSDGFYPVAIYQVGVRANGNYEIAGTH